MWLPSAGFIGLYHLTLLPLVSDLDGKQERGGSLAAMLIFPCEMRHFGVCVYYLKDPLLSGICQWQ